MHDLNEATARWERVRTLMAAQDLDALLAIDLSRDEILQGHQRWLTGFVPVGGPAAALLHRDGSVELISERIGKPVALHYQSHGFPLELVNGCSAALLAERILSRRPLRVGYAESATFPWALAELLRMKSPGIELVDASAAMQQLRLRKSAYEIECVRRSCSIADAVWEQVPALFGIGRRLHDIVSDVDRLAREHGAEGGFHLVLPLPFQGRPMRSLANLARVEPGARYLLEISPRVDGYYSQLTLPVTTRADDEQAVQAYADVVQVKQAVQPFLKPGADLSDVAITVREQLAARGRTLTSLSMGHFCGMALEEPRHDPGVPLRLEEGMTLIFHPVLGGGELHSLMRADTYLITETGAINMNHYTGGLLIADRPSAASIS